MNKYLKRTLVVASVMIIIFSIIMLWPLPLRKVLRQETDTAMTVSLSDNDTNISSFCRDYHVCGALYKTGSYLATVCYSIIFPCFQWHPYNFIWMD